jgi:hypothetical protein
MIEVAEELIEAVIGRHWIGPTVPGAIGRSIPVADDKP